MSEQPEQLRIPPWWTDPTKNVESLVEAAMKRQDDLRTAESVHIRELMALRASYDQRLRDAEAARIDAIQARSDLTVRSAAEVQQTQANTLAAQVLATADAFRALMGAELAPVKASIDDLRRVQYEAQGQKTQVVEARDTSAAVKLSIGTVISIAVLAVAVISLILLYATKK